MNINSLLCMTRGSSRGILADLFISENKGWLLNNDNYFKEIVDELIR